jgi:hypothetical protein
MMSDTNESIYAYPAKVHRVKADGRAALLDLAKNSGAFDASIFDEREPFFWTAEISNGQVDAYYTRMLDTTLVNFADDSRTGIAFLNSHNHDELPMGRSLNAVIDETTGRKRVLTDFFTLPGLKLNGINTNDFIAGVRAGIVSDVSVGFHGGEWYCDICGGNYRKYDSCQHIAGMKVETKNGLTTVTVGIDGARLSEVSAVYDGATPDATIIKARRMAEAGELDPKLRSTIEERYRIKLPTVRTFAGVDLQERKDKLDFEKLLNDVRTALAIDANADVVSVATSVAEQAQRLRSVEADRDAIAGKLTTEQTRAADLESKVKELLPLAEDGRAYRTDLISEAIADGVRAYGESFDAEMYSEVLRSATLPVIKRMKADWAKVGDKTFTGGRQTTDEGEQAKAQPARKVVDESAYKA